MTVRELQARVAADYARLDLPSWPDPHPDRQPLDEEYSRVTEPERYRIVHARAHAWATTLARLLDVDLEEIEPAAFDAERRLRFDRGVRIACSRRDTLPLFLLERDAALSDGDGFMAVLHVSVARPQFVVEEQPDCGCDACDSGSEDLLDAIDETIGNVVGGPSVLLRGKDWSAHWHPGGGSAGGMGRPLDFRQAMQMCRRLADGESVRLPRGMEAFVGESWI